ncbi:hypothetical protein AVEN_255841-1 [Araneus ventricosus]|uniref:Uncharacterized protein n=1 Tax=Araneus ventricosus TaxID=182803 RepID=A0A4Y2ENQ6_ARAVE|nr:hypothetical protein AVEN_255841-1 [Araneus ventricosus]
MLGHSLCVNFAIIKLFVDYVMHSSFAYRQFNNNFTCGDPTILPYELIHTRNCGTSGHNVRLNRAWTQQQLSLFPHRSSHDHVFYSDYSSSGGNVSSLKICNKSFETLDLIFANHVQ